MASKGQAAKPNVKVMPIQAVQKSTTKASTLLPNSEKGGKSVAKVDNAPGKLEPEMSAEVPPDDAAKKAKRPAPAIKKRDSDYDFEPLDSDMQAYVGGVEGDGQTGGWASLLEEPKEKPPEEDEEAENEEEEEEEASEESLSEEEILESPFIWHPSEEDFKESDLAARQKRRYVMGGHSFLELADPNLEDALTPAGTEDDMLSKAEKARRGLKAEKDLYKDLCKQSGIPTNYTFLQALGSSILDLRNHGLTEKEVEAICKALYNDTHIKICILSGNCAGKEGGLAIAGMIENNYTMQELDISNTEIVEVFEEICEAVCMNISLTSLNLAKNELVNEDMVLIGNILAENSSIVHLFLGSNSIKDAGLGELGSGIAENTTLILLDLSGNRIRGEKRAAQFFTACSEHPQIRHLDLRRNIIRNDGAKGISRILANNDRIQYLDLSFNIMEEPSGVPLGRSLNIGPREMETLYLEQQWWHQQAAAAVLKPFGNPDNDMPIELVDFGYMLDIHKSFIKAKDKALALHPDMKIICGEPYGMNKAKGPDAKALVIRRANVVFENFNTPLVMFMEELAKEPKTLTAQEFKKFIKSCNLYKDKSLTEAFANVFPAGPFDVNGETILEAFDKEHPGLRKIPDPELEVEVAAVPKKKKKGKKGKKKGKGGKKGQKGKSKSPTGTKTGKTKSKLKSKKKK